MNTNRLSANLSLVLALSLPAYASVTLEPMIGAHTVVSEDSDMITRGFMGGVRVGLPMTRSLDLEAGAMAGRASGKNGHKEMYEQWYNLGVTYSFAEYKPGNLIPYLGVGTGNFNDRGGMEYAAGLKYVLSNNDALRLDIRDHNHAGRNDVVTTLGYSLLFGQPKVDKPKSCCSSSTLVVPPVPVVEIPKIALSPLVEAPKPVVAPLAEVVKPMPIQKSVVRENMSASTDVYFDFDKSKLKASEVDRLNKFVEATKDMKDFVVNVEGYTDVLGKKGYNQKLSNARAEVVKKYLLPRMKADAIKNVTGKGVKGPQRAEDVRAKNRTVSVRAEGYREVTK